MRDELPGAMSPACGMPEGGAPLAARMQMPQATRAFDNEIPLRWRN